MGDCGKPLEDIGIVVGISEAGLLPEGNRVLRGIFFRKYCGDYPVPHVRVGGAEIKGGAPLNAVITQLNRV